ncbi:MAG: hypothetical protein IPL64_04390 [Flavobacteriales bacterium]|nr:hypothetical protein [Flavobacteriales bacterium]
MPEASACTTVPVEGWSTLVNRQYHRSARVRIRLRTWSLVMPWLPSAGSALSLLLAAARPWGPPSFIGPTTLSGFSALSAMVGGAREHVVPIGRGADVIAVQQGEDLDLGNGCSIPPRCWHPVSCQQQVHVLCQVLVVAEAEEPVVRRFTTLVKNLPFSVSVP